MELDEDTPTASPRGTGSLLRRHLHVYWHWSLGSLPHLRIWTAESSRGEYSILPESGDGEAASPPSKEGTEPEAQSLVKEGDRNEDLDTDATGTRRTQKTHALAHLHPPNCQGTCLKAHFVCHFGLFLFAVVVAVACFAVSAVLALQWIAPISESDLSYFSAANDYTLDPHWNFNDKPRRREYQWTISDMTLNPDGVFRPMMVINEQFPGPLIECNEGDTLIVTVHNKAANATSVHWHGIYQNSTNHMDGTVGVTQCPIGPNQTFTYEFKIERQSGTYWYHGHYGLQASDGILGPLVVHARDERQKQLLDYKSDRVLMIQDHYHDLTGDLLMKYLAPDRENTEPVPDGALLNGKNIRNCDDFPDRICDNSTVALPRIDLDPRGNHRLRIINVGAFAEFKISIDEHEFAVTEVDGTDVKPVYYDTLRISPAQRYSIVVIPKTNSAEGSYWLRAGMLTHCFAEKNPQLDPLLKAVVTFGGASSDDELPSSQEWPGDGDILCRDMNTTDLVPVDVIPAPPTADAFFYLRSNFEIGAWRLSRGFFNTTSWRPNVKSPLLSRAISGLSDGNASFELESSAALSDKAFDLDRELVIQTSGVQVIDLAIQNFDDGNHPMHLHGTKYFVLASGKGHFDATATYPSLDLSNPLRRDTASLEPYSWMLIRFIADNPGVWSLHCHVSWHSEAGLLMNFLIRTDVVKTWTLPEAHQKLCDADGLESGMGPQDEIWFGNTGGS